MPSPRWQMTVTVAAACLAAAVEVSVALAASPVWIEQGPAPNVVDFEGVDEQTGAVEAIAVHPTDPNIVYIASVSGGVWMTSNALDSSPTWYPLTDDRRSLTMRTIAFSRLDTQTLYASFGSTSSGGPLHWQDHYDATERGGPWAGMIKTTTGGRKWFDVPTGAFAGRIVERILPTGIATADGEVVLVATGSGIYRSPDSGTSWIPVLARDTTDLVQDPGEPQRIYAGTDEGVVRSDDAGLDWTLVRVGQCGWQLAVSPTADLSGHHAVYSGCAGTYSMLAVSSDEGETWLPIPDFPDGSGFVGELVTVSDSPAYVMALSAAIRGVKAPAGSSCAGTCDRTAKPACDCGGRWVFRSGSWTRVDGPGAGGTTPHTDGRDWVASSYRDPNRPGTTTLMFEADDGGIYRVLNPVSGPRSWSSANGNLGTAQFVQLAYDDVNHRLFGGAWDLGIPHQTATVTEPATDRRLRWSSNEDPRGDGLNAGVDNCALSCPSTPCCEAVHYSSQQKLFFFNRRTYLQEDGSVSHEPLTPKIEGIAYNVFEGNIDDSDNDELGDFSRRWGAPWRVNAADGRRVILGTGYLYESGDRADTFRSLGGVGSHPRSGAPIPINPVGEVDALAYGHPQNPDVLYVGTSGATQVPDPLKPGTTSQTTPVLWVRTEGSDAPVPQAAYRGAVPYDIAMSPDDWRVAYLVDKSDTVWRTSDAGVTWTDISGVPGDGSIHDVARSLQTITVVPIEGEDFVFVGGLDRSCDPPVEPLTIGPVVGVSPKNQSCGGGVFVSSSTAPLWSNYGIGLPNALVTTLGYDKKDDVLFAGTYGRGAWTIPHLSTLFPPPGPLRPVLGKPACTTSAHGPIITPATPITLRSPEAVTSISYATYPDGSTPVFGSLPPDAATFTISGPPDTYNVEYFANNGGNEGVHGQFSVRLVVDEAFLVRECALEQRQMQLHAYIEKVFHDYPVLRSPVRLVERAQKRVVRAISDAASGNIARSDARIQSALRSHQHLQSRLESPKYQVIDASTRSTLSGMNLDIVYQLDSAVVGQCRACQGTPAPRCGDGVCSAGDETCATCPLDCGECQSCACDQKTRDECQGCAVGCGCCNMCDCGDGVCGNEEDCTVCPADCGPCQLHVFATSAAFSGAEIGGLAGADALCRDEAGAAGLEGAYKAWLSDSGTSAADRISHGTVPYVLVDGTKIADDWDDLTDGSIDAPIVLSASGTDVGFGGAWTATGPSGALSYPANTCANWTSNSGLGADGYRGATSADWTRNSVQPLDYCSVRSVLYCFEQSDSDSAETTTSTSTTSTTTTTTSTMMPCGGTPGACHGACPPGLVCLNNAVCQCGTP